MNDATINVAPIFAVPLAVTEVADAASLNAELESLVLSREQAQYASQPPSPLLSKGVFESMPGILQWQEPCIEKLRGALVNSVGRVVAELSGFSQQELTSIMVMNQTRFHITRHGGGFLPYNHPMASWSSVYCVSAGDDVADFPDSGTIRVLDSRIGQCTYLDPANMRWRTPFSFGHASIRLRAGQLVVFPAYLMREIATYMGERPRITISSSYTFGVRSADAQNPAPAPGTGTNARRT
jgi:hypothetical protein